MHTSLAHLLHHLWGGKNFSAKATPMPCLSASSFANLAQPGSATLFSLWILDDVPGAKPHSSHSKSAGFSPMDEEGSHSEELLALEDD